MPEESQIEFRPSPKLLPSPSTNAVIDLSSNYWAPFKWQVFKTTRAHELVGNWGRQAKQIRGYKAVKNSSVGKYRLFLEHNCCEHLLRHLTCEKHRPDFHTLHPSSDSFSFSQLFRPHKPSCAWAVALGKPAVMPCSKRCQTSSPHSYCPVDFIVLPALGSFNDNTGYINVLQDATEFWKKHFIFT